MINMVDTIFTFLNVEVHIYYNNYSWLIYELH